MIETEEKKTTYYICDICALRISVYVRKCSGCERDICSNCRTGLEYDPWTGEYNGDYREYLCHSCAKVLTPFAKRAKEIYESALLNIDFLTKEWQSQCKAEIDCQKGEGICEN